MKVEELGIGVSSISKLKKKIIKYYANISLLLISLEKFFHLFQQLQNQLLRRAKQK